MKPFSPTLNMSNSTFPCGDVLTYRELSIENNTALLSQQNRCFTLCVTTEHHCTWPSYFNWVWTQKYRHRRKRIRNLLAASNDHAP